MRARRWAAALVLVGALAGCASVKPYEREFLSDPVMDPAMDQKVELRDMKWMEAREGSTGGAGGAGGGCACN
jgi:hypothetical protein